MKTRTRRNLFRILFLLCLFALPGADVECEDGEFEFDWPSFGRSDRDYWYDEPYYDYYYYDPCCYYW